MARKIYFQPYDSDESWATQQKLEIEKQWTTEGKKLQKILSEEEVFLSEEKWYWDITVFPLEDDIDDEVCICDKKPV